ncbi:MAG: site-specific DNA-methyltransferase [Candidatus Zixiibacteriota bacterium]|nr:MAG: site-specific DNA-methyltransferase [candidate division Zixibacteria bacterium]
MEARTRSDHIPHDLSDPLQQCRLRPVQIWHDPDGRHVVGCGDCCDVRFIESLVKSRSAPVLAIHDPPYNVAMFKRKPVSEYIESCLQWVANTEAVLGPDASMYIWMGADQKNHFQPLPQFLAMMAETTFASRSFITMRNQRGYGTQKNWMAVRQELLLYTKGKPDFLVQYTDIPRILRGYYKEIGGKQTENSERSHSDTIRAGNVWVDIQQVFYRMEENVEGCPAQKPLKATERIILASSHEGDTVVDFFSHSGTTLLACERTGRRCITCDIDPVFAEITIRRLEHYRKTGKTGWQRGHPFETKPSEPVQI